MREGEEERKRTKWSKLMTIADGDDEKVSEAKVLSGVFVAVTTCTILPPLLPSPSSSYFLNSAVTCCEGSRL